MFKLNVLTPERKAVFDLEITEVTVPAYSGEMTILPNHAPLITTLGTGILKYKIKNQDRVHKAIISWGYCEVAADAVNVLAEFIQLPEEVVLDKAKTDLLAAEKKLGTESLSDFEFTATSGEIAKAQAGIDILKH